MTLYLSKALRAPAPPFPWEGLASETSVHTNIAHAVNIEQI